MLRVATTEPLAMRAVLPVAASVAGDPLELRREDAHGLQLPEALLCLLTIKGTAGLAPRLRLGLAWSQAGLVFSAFVPSNDRGGDETSLQWLDMTVIVECWCDDPTLRPISRTRAWFVRTTLNEQDVKGFCSMDDALSISGSTWFSPQL